MKNLVAIVKGDFNLKPYAKVINNSRTDNVIFYVNGNKVSVFCVYNQLSEKIQLEKLDWFLKGREYQIQ